MRGMSHFDGAQCDGRTYDTSTAKQYTERVFVVDSLPACMSVKSFLNMALELGLPDLHKEIAKQLISQTKVVPRATVHSRAINFSTSVLTLLMSESLSHGEVDEKDVQRLASAGTSLLIDHFAHIKRPIRNRVLRERQSLFCCIKRVIRLVWRRCGSTIYRHLVGITCIVAVILADREGLIGPNTCITTISRAINMTRYVKKVEIQEVVRHCNEPSDDEEEEQ